MLRKNDLLDSYKDVLRLLGSHIDMVHYLYLCIKVLNKKIVKKYVSSRFSKANA